MMHWVLFAMLGHSGAYTSLCPHLGLGNKCKIADLFQVVVNATKNSWGS